MGEDISTNQLDGVHCLCLHTKVLQRLEEEGEMGKSPGKTEGAQTLSLGKWQQVFQMSLSLDWFNAPLSRRFRVNNARYSYLGSILCDLFPLGR